MACFQRHAGAQDEPARYMRVQQEPRHADRGNFQACGGNVPNVIRLNALSAQARCTHPRQAMSGVPTCLNLPASPRDLETFGANVRDIHVIVVPVCARTHAFQHDASS